MRSSGRIRRSAAPTPRQWKKKSARTTRRASTFLVEGSLPLPCLSGGSIIHTTPVQSEHPDSQLRAYATTQMAVPHFTASLAPQLAAQQIRINAISPGPVWTKRIVTMLSPEEIDRLGRDTPSRRRPAQPAELAPVYVFLASEEAQLITGTVLPVGQSAVRLAQMTWLLCTERPECTRSSAGRWIDAPGFSTTLMHSSCLSRNIA